MESKRVFFVAHLLVESRLLVQGDEAPETELPEVGRRRKMYSAVSFGGNRFPVLKFPEFFSKMSITFF